MRGLIQKWKDRRDPQLLYPWLFPEPTVKKETAEEYGKRLDYEEYEWILDEYHR